MHLNSGTLRNFPTRAASPRRLPAHYARVSFVCAHAASRFAATDPAAPRCPRVDWRRAISSSSRSARARRPPASPSAPRPPRVASAARRPRRPYAVARRPPRIDLCVPWVPLQVVEARLPARHERRATLRQARSRRQRRWRPSVASSSTMPTLAAYCSVVYVRVNPGMYRAHVNIFAIVPRAQRAYFSPPRGGRLAAHRHVLARQSSHRVAQSTQTQRACGAPINPRERDGTAACARSSH